MNVNLGEINLPNLVNAALPENRKKGGRTNTNHHDESDSHASSSGADAKQRNVAILSDNWTAPAHRDQSFLSSAFPRGRPKLYVTAESDDFDAQTLADWRDEGFDVAYLPLGDAGPDAYRSRLRALHADKALGPCAIFGIVAYGDAAAVALEHYHVLDNNHEMKLGLLVAYYPTRIPDPNTKFPSAVRALVHLPVGSDVGIVKQSQVVGIQGKKRVARQKVTRGMGTGGTLPLGYPTYSYDEVEAGFAEHDLDEYDRISAELAWSRSLKVARRAFGMDGDVELMAEQNAQGKFFTRSVEQTLATYTTHKTPHVTYVPTLSGGIGTQELQDFYTQYFINSNPPSMYLTLLSRTVGVDRVVDEIHISFRHTQDMPWILPGVPPTNKKVEVIVVSIVTLKSGKLQHEHVYWDQASVLVQVGLLDPKVVPEKAKEMGVKRLPVVGRRGAKRLLEGMVEDEEGEADNELIYQWEDDQKKGEEESEEPEALGDKSGKEDHKPEKNGKEKEDDKASEQNDQETQNGENEEAKEVSGEKSAEVDPEPEKEEEEERNGAE